MYRNRPRIGALGTCAAGFVAWLGASCLGGAARADEPLWHEHPHHLSLLVAGSDDAEETALTLGVDYEYRLNALLGLGVVAEYAFEEIDAVTVLAVADLHLWRGLIVQTGPGIEIVDGPAGGSDDLEIAYRVGVLYELEVGHFTVSPQLHYDFTSGENSFVFGGAVGVGF
ncbi:MAG: hypothetical protein AAF430_02540 [Myxococcota bacterium]